MSERDALFWMKFSHEWSGGLLTSLAFLMLFTIAARTVQKRAPANLAMVRTSKVATWALLSGGAFFLWTQMHIPCAAVASHSSSCLSNVKGLTQAQNMYAEDHDGLLLSIDDWASRLPSQKGNFSSPARCAGAEGPVSYALNKRLVGVRTNVVDNPAATPQVFDADGKSVCGRACLATGRHLGSPIVGFADGHATPVRRSSALQW